MQELRRTNLKRVLCLLMAIAMLFTMLPAAAFALDDEQTAATAPNEVIEDAPEDVEEATPPQEETPQAEATPADVEISPFNLIPAGVNLPSGITIHNVTHGGTGAGGLRNYLGSGTRAIRLMNSVEVTGTTIMNVSGTLHIFSNTDTTEEAFTINRAGGDTRIFGVTGGNVHLHNVTVTTPSNATTGGGVSITGGHLHLHEGSTISNGRHAEGGGIHISSGQMTMNGGTIANNVSTRNTSGSGGGGVLIGIGATFTMRGGTIRDNQAFNTGGGVQVSHTGGSGASTFNMSGGLITNNTAMRNHGTANAAGAGGGIHLNSEARVNLSGDAAVVGNTAGATGGGVRIYGESNSTIFTMTGNARIADNVAGTNGGGISSRLNVNHINITNWSGEITGNTAGVRNVGNPNAGGSGGGIHVQASGGRLTVTGTGSITNNTADNGGGIFTNLANLPASGTIAANVVTIASGITFDGNTARNGMQADEGLASRNAANFPHVGSLEWMGVSTAAPVTAQLRNHIFNNADINIRTGVFIREITYSVTGTAADSSTITARITSVPNGSQTIPVNPAHEFASGQRLALVGSQVEYEVTPPSTAAVIGWSVNGGANTNAGATTLGPRAIANTSPNLVPDNTVVTVNYRYHSVIFNVTSGGTLTEGTQTGQTSITRDPQREGTTVGAPPTPVANEGYVFAGWTHNGAPITAAAIAAMNVTGPLTFVATFDELVAHGIRIVPTSRTLGNMATGDFTAEVLDQNGDVLPNQESFIINWVSTTPANVTVSPASNPAGQANTTTARAELMTLPGAYTITATLAGTNLEATATVNVIHADVAHSLVVNPAESSVRRGSNATLTATVLNQFGNPMPNQNSFVINWVSEETANVTVAPATSAAGTPNTTVATGTAAAEMGSTNTVRATLGDTDIIATAEVTIATDANLRISYMAQDTPQGMQWGIGEPPTPVGTNTEQTVGIHAVAPGEMVSIHAGGWNITNQTFLGWFTAEEVENLPTNEAGNQYVPDFEGPVNRQRGPEAMPVNDTHMVAVWGNQRGEVSQLNDDELEISYVAASTPTGMILEVDGTIVADGTANVVGIHHVVPDTTVRIYSGSTPNQTFLGWFTEAEFAALPTNAAGNQYVPNFTPPAEDIVIGDMPAGGIHMIAVWGNQHGVVSQLNDYPLTVSYRAQGTPAGMTITVDGEVIAANTAQAVGTHNVVPGLEVSLYAGNSPRQTFLGWMTYEQLAALPTNAAGQQYIPGFTDPADRTLTDAMPAHAIHMVAVWGNQSGVVSQFNDGELEISYVARHTPVGMTMTVNGVVRAANTTETVGIHDVLPGAAVVLYAGTTERQTFLGWMHNAELEALPVNAAGDRYVPGFDGRFPANRTLSEAMPEHAVHMVAVWGNQFGVVSQYNYEHFTVTHEPEVGINPVGMTLTLNGLMIASNTPAVVTASHAILGGSELVLDAGTLENFTFLGWMHEWQVRALPVNADGYRYIANFDNLVGGLSQERVLAYDMPNEHIHLVAVWGNQHGVVGRPNDDELRVSYVARNTPVGMTVTVNGTVIAENTAEAVDSHLVSSDATIVLYAGATERQTFLGWMTEAQFAALPTNSAGHQYVPGFTDTNPASLTHTVTMPESDLHMIAVWGNQFGVVSQYNYNSIAITYQARTTPEGMTLALNGVEIASNTAATVESHAIVAGSTLVLNAGNAENQTFLGWMHEWELNELPLNADGHRYLPDFDGPASRVLTMTMPQYNIHMVAVWGNQHGVVSQPNDNVLILSYRAQGTPVGMTYTLDDVVVGANTAATVGTHNVAPGQVMELYAGNSPRQTFLGWMHAGDLAELPTNSLGQQYVPGFTGEANRTHIGSMPNEAVHLVAVWGNQHGVVSQFNTNSIAVTYVAANTPVGMTLTMDGLMIASNTAATVASHAIVGGSELVLNAGNATNQTFLGWMHQWEFEALEPNADGYRYIPDFDGPANRILTMEMPTENIHMVAVWGNQHGVVSQPNDHALTITYVASATPTGASLHLDGTAATGNVFASRDVLAGTEVRVTSGSVARQTFLGWFTAEEFAALPTNAAGNQYVPGFEAPASATHTVDMPISGLHLIAVWGNQAGVVSQFNNYPLTISYAARGIPVGMTYTLDDVVVGANTAATVGTHDVIVDAVMELYAGDSPRQTFLGWMHNGELEALPINASGDRFIPNFTGPADRTHRGSMPAEAVHLVAVWGNQHGVVSQYNTNSIAITYVAGTTPVGMTFTANGFLVAANTAATVTTHAIVGGSELVLDAGNVADQTFLGWMHEWELNNLPTNAAGQQYLPDFDGPADRVFTMTMPTENIHMVAVWGNQHGVVTQPNNNPLTISYEAQGTPAGMTMSLNDAVVAANTAATVGTHSVAPGAVMVLDAGNSPRQTFLGWMHAGELEALPVNTDGHRYIENFVPPTTRTHTGSMPAEAVHLVAVWGNQHGVVSQFNDYELEVSFNARNTPAGMTMSVNGTVVAANTAATVGTHDVVFGAVVVLYAGLAPHQTFLGWFERAQVDAFPTNAAGNQYVPNFTPPVDTAVTMAMPDRDVHMVAVWGNQRGELGQYNDVSIIYNANGGVNPPPARLLPPGTHTLTNPPTGMTHPDVDGETVRFMGWSRTQTEIFAVGAIAEWTPLLITELNILHHDVTVYAVWAFVNIYVTGDYSEDGSEVVVGVNLPSSRYTVSVNQNRVNVVIENANREDVSVTRLPGPGWTYDRIQSGNNVTVIMIPPADSGYELVRDPETGKIHIWVTATFNAGAHGTFAPATGQTASRNEVPVRVLRGTTLEATHVPAVIENSEGRPHVGWARSNPFAQMNPVGHVVVRAITFTALYEGDIIVDGSYSEDGSEMEIGVNLPDNEYEVTVDDENNTIVVEIEDAEKDDVVVNLPPGWTYEKEQDGDNVIVIITPPPSWGYELEQDPETGAVLIFITIRFNAGEHGSFSAPADEDDEDDDEAVDALNDAATDEDDEAAPITVIERRVPRGTLIRVADVPEVNVNEGYTFFGWNPNPLQHVVLRAVTFVAQFDEISQEEHLRYMIGDNYGNFRPRAPITRAEVAIILVRTQVREFATVTNFLPLRFATTGFNEFSDVNRSDWFYFYIAWAYAEGYVRGFDGEFRPDEFITREELAAMIVRTGVVLPTDGVGVPGFPDFAQTSDWAKEYVAKVYELGLMVGDAETGQFRPLHPIQRGETATAMNRLLGRVDSQTAWNAVEVENPEEMRTFPDVNPNYWYFGAVVAATNDHVLTRDEDDNIEWKEFIVRTPAHPIVILREPEAAALPREEEYEEVDESEVA